VRKAILLALLACGCESCPEQVQPSTIQSCGIVCAGRVLSVTAIECRCQEAPRPVPERVEVLP
jgi:hypothetical protein